MHETHQFFSILNLTILLTMITIDLLIILLSLSSGLCLDCSDVKQSNGFGVHVTRDPNGKRSHWIYDKNGKEWELYLKEKNGMMDIDLFGNETFTYDRDKVNRFSNSFQFSADSDPVAYKCEVSDSMLCWIGGHRVTKQLNNIENELVFKTYPDKNGLEEEARYMVAYNRHNKGDRRRLNMFFWTERRPPIYDILFEPETEDILFIKEMNDSLFKQIDSMIDYHTESGLSGHIPQHMWSEPCIMYQCGPNTCIS